MAKTNTSSSKRKVGGHVSMAGGLHHAIDRAEAIGANCAQVFSGSPRVWARKDLDDRDLDTFFSKQQEKAVKPIFTHALYLVNVASKNQAQVEKSIKALVDEMAFDSAIKGAGVIVHVGSHQGRGWDAVREQVAASIATVIEQSPNNATFLIENSAGQQGKVNSDLAEIRWLLDQVKSARLGWCVDTCHAHAAGYALGKETTTPDKSRLDRDTTLEQAIDEHDLWDSLQCIHVNDSQAAFGSGVDRHENIGDGTINPDDMAYFLNVSQINKDIPLITEVPGLEDDGPDKANIERIKKLLGQ